MATAVSFQSLLTLGLLIALFCGVMPLLGGGLLYRGFQKFQVSEVPLQRCVHFFFAAAGVAYLFMMVVGRFLPGSGEAAGVALAGAIVVILEVGLIAALVRKFTARVILVETGAVVLTNLAGYGLVTFLL